MDGPVNTDDNRIIPAPSEHPLVILLCLGSAAGASQTGAPPSTPTGSPAEAPTPPVGVDLRRFEPLAAYLRDRGAEVEICYDTFTAIRFSWDRRPHTIIVVDDRLFHSDVREDLLLQHVVISLTAFAMNGGYLIFRPSFGNHGALQPMFRQRFGLDWQIRGHFTLPVRRGGWLDLVREDLLERLPEEYTAAGAFIDSATPAFPMYFSTGILADTNSRLASTAAGRLANGLVVYCGDDITQREADQIISIFCGV